MNAASKLESLKAWLKNEGLDAFILPVADEYLSEYVPAHAMRLAWLTGFTGSAGTVVVTKDQAVLFTDGRYTLQASQQLDMKLYQVINSGERSPSDWLSAATSGKVGYDPALHDARSIERMEQKGLSLVAVAANPVDALWADRPEAPANKAWRYEEIYAGESAASKLRCMAKAVAEAGADALFMAASENINWLLNIRGGDVECTPIIQVYGLLKADATLTLFAAPDKISDHVLPKEVKLTVQPVSAVSAAIAALAGKTLMVEYDATPARFVQLAMQHGVKTLDKADPISLAKAVKNETELKHIRRVHVQDGAALVSTLFWLQQAVRRGEAVDEMLVEVMLRQQRSKQQGFIGLSFPAIVGSGPHGAIIHYRMTEATSRRICSGELLLIDSGGQYLGGTTDVTRTLAIGSPTAAFVDHYTRVLKGHIALASAIFPKGTTGSQLDVLARQFLWEAGLDYDHGTGHGVGACLSVHEGPQRISKRGGRAVLQPGMILSNEPGYYQNGSHGIRLENLVEVVERVLPNGMVALAFANLTLVPFDSILIDKELLTADEIKWLNAYHANVVASLSGYVDDDVREWLKRVCAKI